MGEERKGTVSLKKNGKMSTQTIFYAEMSGLIENPFSHKINFS